MNRTSSLVVASRLAWGLSFALISPLVLAQGLSKSDSLSSRFRNIVHCGERLEYDMEYGFITLGRCTVELGAQVYRCQSGPCYRVDARGYTTGVAAWMAKVDDYFTSYVDTTARLGYSFYRRIREGNYRKEELTVFDHNRHTALVRTKNDKTGQFDSPKTYAVPVQARDIISSFLYVIGLDVRKKAVGDTLSLHSFFEDQSYDVKIVYRGKEVVKTSLGRVPCIKLTPVMPKNKLFDGRDSIVCWLSDDENAIPVKLQMKMFVGSFKLEIAVAKNLPRPLVTVER